MRSSRAPATGSRASRMIADRRQSVEVGSANVTGVTGAAAQRNAIASDDRRDEARFGSAPDATAIASSNGKATHRSNDDRLTPVRISRSKLCQLNQGVISPGSGD